MKLLFNVIQYIPEIKKTLLQTIQNTILFLNLE